MIADKIKPKIAKVISKFPTSVEVYRDELNEYNEPIGRTHVCNVTGFYHENTNGIKVDFSRTDKGEISRTPQRYLMLVYDDTTIQIKEDDYFYLDNIKYIIKDKGNSNRLNIYYDMLLEVI